MQLDSLCDGEKLVINRNSLVDLVNIEDYQEVFLGFLHSIFFLSFSHKLAKTYNYFLAILNIYNL